MSFEDDHSYAGKDNSITISSQSESDEGNDSFIESDNFEIDPDNDSNDAYEPQKEMQT
jgi:hypothetical protein